MYKIYDNLIPLELQNRLEQMLDSDQFEWYALDNISLGFQDEKFTFTYKDGYDYIETHGMSHLTYKDDLWYEPYGLYMMARQIIDYVTDIEGINVNRILRIKANFLTQNPNKNFNEMSINFPHLDNYNEHKVLVYYVNDSDGDTILFNEKWEIGDDKKENIDLTTEARVKPKKGRILLFDGLQYHTSQNPINSEYRIILNINIC